MVGQQVGVVVVAQESEQPIPSVLSSCRRTSPHRDSMLRISYRGPFPNTMYSISPSGDNAFSDSSHDSGKHVKPLLKEFQFLKIDS